MIRGATSQHINTSHMSNETTTTVLRPALAGHLQLRTGGFRCMVRSFTARMPSLTSTGALGEDAGVLLGGVIYTVSLPNNKWVKLQLVTRRHQTQLRITKALLVVSTVFVALNLPRSLSTHCSDLCR